MSRGVVLAALAALACLAVPPASSSAGAARDTTVHFACSGPNSAHEACHFATPSGNVRCLWTPSPNRIECVLLATGRAYRLTPKGRARKVVLRLTRPGQTLPRRQQIVFPQSMSCRDTRTTMTCNQDFGTGAFVLALGHSHAS